MYINEYFLAVSEMDDQENNGIWIHRIRSVSPEVFLLNLN